MMKLFSDIHKVFSFTLMNQFKKKSWKNITVIIAIICLLLPVAIMCIPELISNDSEAYDAAAPASVYVYDDTGNHNADFSILNAAGDSIYSSVNYKTVADQNEGIDSVSSDDDSLFIILSEENSRCKLTAVRSDESRLTEDDADAYCEYVQQYLPFILLSKNKTDPMQAQTAASITYVSNAYININGEDTAKESSEISDINSSAKNICASLLPYVNFMILYFLLLAYGQSTSGSIVLEKSSKLMDTMLLSLKPESLTLGKVFAHTCSALLQSGIWIAALIAGCFSGIHLVNIINPHSDSMFIMLFSADGFFTDIFTAGNILFFIVFLAGGLLLYLSLAAIGGALAGKQEDLNSTNFIFIIVLVISFFAVIRSLADDSVAAAVDWIPFTSVMIAPSHIMLGSFSAINGLVSLAITLILSVIVLIVAGRVYKATALYKGKTFSVKDILSILKMKN